MTLQSRIDTAGQQKKLWSSPPEQIPLGHGHHIQPSANSLARRLRASEDRDSDDSLVHRISPCHSNLLSRIQGHEMYGNGDTNTEREDERALISDFMTVQSPFASENATKTLRRSAHFSRSATPTANPGSTLAQMFPDPSTSKYISSAAIQRKSILYEDSATPSSGSPQIRADVARTTLISAISQNAKLRRGPTTMDMSCLGGKVNAVVTNEANELFLDTIQRAKTELREKQAVTSDDESPASTFLKGLSPSLIKETKTWSQSLVSSVHTTAEPEKPKILPAAPRVMLSPGIRLVESMLQAGSDLTLPQPDEELEPDSIMHATRMPRPSSSYHRNNMPSHTVRSDSRTNRSFHNDASASRHHRYTSELKTRSSRHSKSPLRSFSPVNRKPSHYDARSPSPDTHQSRTPRIFSNQRSSHDQSRSPHRGRPEKRSHRDYSDPSPRRDNYSAQNRSTSSKCQSRYDRRRQYPDSSRRLNRESLSPARGDPSKRDSQWTTEAKTEHHTVYDEPEPMHNLHSVSDVPGVWAFQLSRDSPDILEYSFSVGEEIAAKWNLTRENNWVVTEEKTRDELFLHLICLPTALAVPTLDSLLIESSQEPKAVASALWNMQTEWPEQGSLIIEINPGKTTGRVLFPGDLSNIHNPLEITHAIQKGINTIRFVQLTGMQKSFFLLASQRDIPTLDLTVLDEILQFRTP
ncbi:uncharacterized protein BT62DRAFT_927002 [Guyanagaster necrorhizus]|uniref:Uncharacterized protein n=1 Tax=Guyanagaster necrorhizus TaxID=856835 RepID=A0A9P8AXK5_9AGAR|nr:uncharacterized protein BT62DRAFT_927002 [Guyanagaster necrorhizus MCA 3950]KAG7451326.1 hypothetical protein BT62DRAFT_927002 [Guyanagaster necrorhizus MCA 3950]